MQSLRARQVTRRRILCCMSVGLRNNARATHGSDIWRLVEARPRAPSPTVLRRDSRISSTHSLGQCLRVLGGDRQHPRRIGSTTAAASPATRTSNGGCPGGQAGLQLAGHGDREQRVVGQGHELCVGASDEDPSLVGRPLIREKWTFGSPRLLQQAPSRRLLDAVANEHEVGTLVGRIRPNAAIASRVLGRARGCRRTTGRSRRRRIPRAASSQATRDRASGSAGPTPSCR